MIQEGQIIIRTETASDFAAVSDVVRQAFGPLTESDHKEHLLVGRLRRSKAFIPELSLVAETQGGKIIGHILLTRIHIISQERRSESLAVAPVSVLPDYQRQGTGSALIREAHLRATALGFHSAVLLGHPDYYPRFGYEPASRFGIRFPFDAPEECCMAIELVPGGLTDVSGVVEYDPAFGL